MGYAEIFDWIYSPPLVQATTGTRLDFTTIIDVHDKPVRGIKLNAYESPDYAMRFLVGFGEAGKWFVFSQGQWVSIDLSHIEQYGMTSDRLQRVRTWPVRNYLQLAVFVRKIQPTASGYFKEAIVWYGGMHGELSKEPGNGPIDPLPEKFKPLFPAKGKMIHAHRLTSYGNSFDQVVALSKNNRMKYDLRFIVRSLVERAELYQFMQDHMNGAFSYRIPGEVDFVDTNLEPKLWTPFEPTIKRVPDAVGDSYEMTYSVTEVILNA